MLDKRTLKLGIFFGIILSLTASVSLQARSPAVEDFVGVETEGYQQLNPGEEFAYQFGNTVLAAGDQSNPITSNQASSSLLVPFIVLTAFSLLPFIMWLTITRSTSYSKEAPLGQKGLGQDLELNNVMDLSQAWPEMGKQLKMKPEYQDKATDRKAS